MNQQPSRKPLEGLVFYVDEQGDDFTFHTSRGMSDAVISSLALRRLRDRWNSGSAGQPAPPRDFSFLQKIKIKNLILTKDSFKEISDKNPGLGIGDTLWDGLRSPAKGTKYKFLLDRAKEAIKASSRSAEDDEKRAAASASKVIRKMPKAAPTDEEKRLLLPFFATALNTSIANEDVQSQVWAKGWRLDQEQRDRIANLSTRKKRAWQNRLLLERTFSDLFREFETGRGLICLSYQGKALSITVRKQKDKSGFADLSEVNRKKTLFSLKEYCSRIYDEIFIDPKSTAHGLLVVTGSTNSAKSEIARGLIELYLTSREGEERRRHLITFEEPIEKYYGAYPGTDGHPAVALEMPTRRKGVDYTPRECGSDVGGLKTGLTDALRQTPAVFFVGETREKEEWELLLDFAASGHLIVTTAHAGSLVEAMHKIFEARHVTTPADRSEIASKLLGVVHLRSDRLAIDDAHSTTALFPALWRRSSRGVSALTSDGLASLLPHRQRPKKGEDAPSCLGRTWFVESLITSDLKCDLTSLFGSDCVQTMAHRKAIEWDLQGV